MYAVIKTGGKQYRVKPEEKLTIERIKGEAGDIVEFGEVLMLAGESGVTLGAPFVAGATVAAELVAHTRGDRIIIFKKKRRHHYRRRNGHRQDLTEIRITEILTDGKKPSKKAAERKPAKAKAEPKEAPAAKEAAAAAAPKEPTVPAAKDYCVSIIDAAADARVAWQKKLLADAGKEIDERIAQLEQKTAEYKAWLKRRDEFTQRATDTVLQIYKGMRPDAAALQIALLDDETAAAVLVKLEPARSSRILNDMDPARAAKLTATIVGSGKVYPAAT